MKDYFNVPTQVIFRNNCNSYWNGGIAFQDKIICLCCGGIIEIAELLANDGEIKVMPWENLSEELTG